MSENNDLSDKMIGSVVHGIKSNAGPFPLEEDEMYTDMGKELSDQMIAAQKAAYEAGEDKPEFVGTPKGENKLQNVVDGKQSKPPSLEDMLRDQMEAGGVIVCKCPEDMAKKIREMFGDEGDEDDDEDLPKYYSLTEEEEEELREILDKLKAFLEKHSIPAEILLQLSRKKDGGTHTTRFCALPGSSRTDGRLNMVQTLVDLAYDGVFNQGDYDKMMMLMHVMRDVHKERKKEKGDGKN